MNISHLIQSMSGNPRPALLYETADERLELSYHVVGNWISKICNLLVLDSALMPGDAIVVDMPLHWRSIMWSAGAMASGVEPLADDKTGRGALWVACTEESAERALDAPAGYDVYLQVLPALALRWPGSVPEGAEDASQAIMSCADALISPDAAASVEDAELAQALHPASIADLDGADTLVLGGIGPQRAAVAAMGAWHRGVSVVVTDSSGMKKYADDAHALCVSGNA